jgi:hypothetical protein
MTGDADQIVHRRTPARGPSVQAWNAHSRQSVPARFGRPALASQKPVEPKSQRSKTTDVRFANAREVTR